MRQAVDVVIRTAGRSERRTSLQRAVQSILNQQGVAARPIVVITDNLPHLATELACEPRVKVHHVGQPTSPGRALGIGRSVIQAPFYAFLDDDDELLPSALEMRLDIMRADPAVDLVVTTGYWVSGNRRQIHIPDITRHQNDSLNGMIERCWLTSCGGLYRASAISQRHFEGLPDLCEWTYFAFRLSLERLNVRFLDLPTYNVYDTPGSLSKTEGFLEATLCVLQAMRSQPLRAAERASLERKYRAALHGAAEHYRQANQLAKAWRFHLRSVKPPYMLRYGAYTRKLLWTRKTAGDRSEG